MYSSHIVPLMKLAYSHCVFPYIVHYDKFIVYTNDGNIPVLYQTIYIMTYLSRLYPLLVDTGTLSTQCC